MAKTKTSPRAPAPTQVTTAAKRPNRTKKFLADISAALEVFDDEIFSVGDCRATHTKLLYHLTKPRSPTFGRR